MKKVLALTALVVSLAAAAPVNAATYVFNDSVGVGSASGSITTNDALGVLTTADITGFNITINDGVGSFVLTDANAGRLVLGAALTATATGLFFNFSAAGTNALLFQNPGIGSSINFFCLQSSGCYSPNVGSGEGLRLQGAVLSNSRQGNVQFAQVVGGGVPEPATWAMLLAGFGAVGFALRRKPRARVRFA